MPKQKLKPSPYMYPKPAVLVGAMVKGKPNFLTVANAGIICYHPPMLYVASSRGHYTNLGIRRQKSFSLNVPSADMAPAVDYCGLHSGRRTDKSGLFSVFFGELKTAPMIAECPVCFECRLVKTLRLGGEEVFIGEMTAIYAETKVLKNGKPAIKKINPLIYSTSDKQYFRLGSVVGDAYRLGKDRPVRKAKKS